MTPPRFLIQPTDPVALASETKVYVLVHDGNRDRFDILSVPPGAAPLWVLSERDADGDYLQLRCPNPMRRVDPRAPRDVFLFCESQAVAELFRDRLLAREAREREGVLTR